MEQKNGKSFNCAESVIIAANREAALEDCHPSCLKIASMFGGGVAGTGEVCGAVTGAIMHIGMTLGTDGGEDPTEFSEKRKKARAIGQQFIKEFIEKWGSQRCSALIDMDNGQIPSLGTLRMEDPELRKRCDEYVQWSIKYVSRLMKS